MNSQITSNDLQQKITDYLEELAKETDLVRKSEEMQKYLNFVARFHQYSPSNIFLIMLAKPNATRVAGFQAWKMLGRYVKRGERGIPILSPLISKEDPDDDNSLKVLHGFRIVFVFDIAQTDGKPIPPVPDWKSPEKNLELSRCLVQLAERRGISVTFKELNGEIQGVSMGGAIEIDKDAGTKTLIHEIVHEVLHQNEKIYEDRVFKEMEAETVAFVVSKYFGITNLKSPNYLCLHGISSKMILQDLSIVLKCANQIITEVSEQLVKEYI